MRVESYDQNDCNSYRCFSGGCCYHRATQDSERRSEEPESESESEVPEESDVPMESEIPKNVRRLMERARAVQQKYWTPNSEEKKRL